MGQVPVVGRQYQSHKNNQHEHQFLLIGSGRLCRHLSFYFSTLGIPLANWSRNGDPRFNSIDNTTESNPSERLQILLKRATHVWILVKDDAIAEVSEMCGSFDGIKLHCSGSLKIKEVFGVHPLMTFGPNLYEESIYLKIPFILEPETPDLSALSPLLSNPQVRLQSELKALYHALCVASGNFTVLLWQMAKKEFNQIGIDWPYLQPYLHQTFFNLSHFPDQALTGPFIRQDQKTIIRHLNALKDHPLGDVYKLMWDLFCTEKTMEKKNVSP